MQFDDIPASTVATKMMTDLAAGGTYDVYAVDEPFIPQFKDSLLPMNLWPKTPTDSELAKFEPKALEAATVENRLIGLPVNGNVYQYIFRKDLFESEQEKVNFQLKFDVLCKLRVLCRRWFKSHNFSTDHPNSMDSLRLPKCPKAQQLNCSGFLLHKDTRLDKTQTRPM